MAAGGCGRGPLSAPFGSGRGAQGVGKGFLEWLCPELNPRGAKKGVRAIPEKRGLWGTTDCSLVIDGMVAGTARGPGSAARGGARHGAAGDQPGPHTPTADRQGPAHESQELAPEETRKTPTSCTSTGSLSRRHVRHVAPSVVSGCSDPVSTPPCPDSLDALGCV